MIEKNLALFVLKNGKLYIPATNHYPMKNGVNVVCDYCGKNNLTICIGYNTVNNNGLDLCMMCVEELSKLLYKSSIEEEEIESTNVF